MEAGERELKKLVKREEEKKGKKLTKREKMLIYYKYVLPKVNKKYGAYV